jgi:hypothetical protein
LRPQTQRGQKTRAILFHVEHSREAADVCFTWNNEDNERKKSRDRARLPGFVPRETPSPGEPHRRIEGRLDDQARHHDQE